MRPCGAGAIRCKINLARIGWHAAFKAVILSNISAIGGGTMSEMTEVSRDYERIEKALHFLEQNYQKQPELEEIANYCAMSPYHFQRLFARWAGISPKRFLQFLTVEHAKILLQQSRSILDASLTSGLSGPGRLHDLFVSCEAVTPGQFKSKGAGIEMKYGIHDSPFGRCFIAATEKGVCSLGFLKTGEDQPAERDLMMRWEGTRPVRDDSFTAELNSAIFTPLIKRRSQTGSKPQIRLLVRGTNFQIKVWQALLAIPPGKVLAYSDVATLIGSSNATRAVASAVARNPISYLIPCHRIIRKIGVLGQYGWGSARKKAMLGLEITQSLPRINTLLPTNNLNPSS